MLFVLISFDGMMSGDMVDIAGTKLPARLILHYEILPATSHQECFRYNTAGRLNFVVYKHNKR
jgi:hypothetical protein